MSTQDPSSDAFVNEIWELNDRLASKVRWCVKRIVPAISFLSVECRTSFIVSNFVRNSTQYLRVRSPKPQVHYRLEGHSSQEIR